VDPDDRPVPGVTLIGLYLPTARTEIAPGLASASDSRSGLSPTTTGPGGQAEVLVFASTSAPAQIAAGASNPLTQFEVPSITADTTITVRADGVVRKRVGGVVRTAEGEPVPGHVVTVSGPESLSQATADDGSYSAAVTPGAYQVSVTSGGAHRPDLPTQWSLPLQVTSVQSDRTIDVDLPAVHTLTVRVLDQNGDPLPRAQITGLSLPTAVTEISPGLPTTSSARSGPGSVTTDEDGLASVAVFPSTPAAAQIGAGESNPPTQFEVPSITRDTTLIVRADGLTRARVGGTVRTAGGSTIAGARVALDGPEFVSQSTTASGSYLAALTPGVYRFRLDASGAHMPGLPSSWTLPLDATSIQADRSIDFALPAVHRLHVVVLRENDQPIEGARVTGLELRTVRTALAPGIFTTDDANSGSPSVTTKADGSADVSVFPSPGGSGVVEAGPDYPRVEFNVKAVTADATVVVRIEQVDRVKPHIVCAARDVEWHADNVAVACTSSDEGFGLADPGDATFVLHTDVPEGTETDVAVTGSRTVCDRGTPVSNCETAGPFSRIKVDRRDPDPGCGQPPAGWLAANASIVCSASDGGSGLASAASFVLRTTVDSGVETTTAATDSTTVCDGVGNCVAAGPFTALRIDRRAPDVACAAADPAPRTTNATVACTASDGGARLASATDSMFELQTHVAPGSRVAAAMTGSREICDAARNCVTAGPVGPFDIDLTTAPTPRDDKDHDGIPDSLDFCPEIAGNCIPRLPAVSERDRRATMDIARRVVAATCAPDRGVSALASTASAARPKIGVGGSVALRAASRHLCGSGLTALVALGDTDPVPDDRTASVHVVTAAYVQIQAIRAAKARCRGNAACRSVTAAAGDLARAGDDLEAAALELSVARNRLATAIVGRRNRDKSLQSALVALLERNVARAQTAERKAVGALSRAATVVGASMALPANALLATTEALRAGQGIPARTTRRLVDAGMSSPRLVAILKDLPAPAVDVSLGRLFDGSTVSSRVAIGRTLTLTGLKAIVLNLASTAAFSPGTTRALLNDLRRASSVCSTRARRSAIAKFGRDAIKVTRTRMLVNVAEAVKLPRAGCP
jgi:hypothetical protein